MYDEAKKIARWTIGTLVANPTKIPLLTGTMVIKGPVEEPDQYRSHGKCLLRQSPVSKLLLCSLATSDIALIRVFVSSQGPAVTKSGLHPQAESLDCSRLGPNPIELSNLPCCLV